MSNNIEKLASEITDELNEGRYGSIVLIMYTLIIMVNTIKLWKLCREKDEELYGMTKDMGIMERLFIRRQINKYYPDMERADRKRLLGIIVRKAAELPWEDFIKILAEVDQYTTYQKPDGTYGIKSPA